MGGVGTPHPAGGRSAQSASTSASSSASSSAAAAAPYGNLLWFPALMACSVGMVLLNKTLSVNFPQPNTTLGLQNGASVLYLLAGGGGGNNCISRLLPIRGLNVFDLSVPFRISQFRPFLYPTLNWVIMLALSLKMLQYNSVATTVVFKTLGTILICTIDTIVFGVRYSRRAKAALGLLVFGSAIYAGFDVNFSAVGYTWATLQICSWVLQTFVEKVATVESEQTKAGVAVIRNLLSLPVVAVLILGSGEVGALGELMHRREVWGQVALSSLLGCGLGLSTSALYKSYSPTTVVVANNIGKCVSIVAGCLLFDDRLLPTQVLGLGLSLAGSFWYGQEEKSRLEEEKRMKASGGAVTGHVHKV